jgi:hypothetical protein
VGGVARVIFACCLLAMATSAKAQLSTGTVYHPNSGTLYVPVTASVGGRCGFVEAPDGSEDYPDFDVTGVPATQFPFVLECTGPSRVAIVSENGGLETGGVAPVGYATLAPYDVKLNLVANNTANNVTATCAVADLVGAGGCSFRGPATTTDGLLLPSASTNQTGSYVEVSAPPYAGTDLLVSGSYADTLTVTLSPAL